MLQLYVINGDPKRAMPPQTPEPPELIIDEQPPEESSESVVEQADSVASEETGALQNNDEPPEQIDAEPPNENDEPTAKQIDVLQPEEHVESVIVQMDNEPPTAVVSITESPSTSNVIQSTWQYMGQHKKWGFILIAVMGCTFAFYIATTTGSTVPHHAPKSLNPAYASAIMYATSLNDASTFQDNLGSQIVSKGKLALGASKNNVEREVSEYWIGIGYFWESENALAVAHEQQSISYNSSDPLTYVAEGNVLVDEKNYTQALSDADHAIALNARLATAYRLKAIVLANQGEKSAALAALNQAIIIDEGPNKTQFKSSDLDFYTYINNTEPPLYISP